MRKPPLWLFVDIDRLAEAIDRERTQARPAASESEPFAVELFAVVRRSAGFTRGSSRCGRPRSPA